jgi:hypothetical protein
VKVKVHGHCLLGTKLFNVCSTSTDKLTTPYTSTILNVDMAQASEYEPMMMEK